MHRTPCLTKLLSILTGFAFVFAITANTHSQETATSNGPNNSAGTPAADPIPLPSPSPSPAHFKDRIGRWFELQTGSISTRYRFVDNRNDVTLANQDQYSLALRAKLKFDPKGRFSLTAAVATGNIFIGGWNNTGWGTGNAQSHLFLKELFLEAKPIKGVEIQFGGLDIQHGVSTEVTTYDNDGHIMGERLTLHQPKHLYFDTVAVTYGYLGDLTKASVTNRWRRLGQSNYHQFLVVKKLSDHVSFSADYTFQSGIDTLHQAIKFTMPKHKFIDTLLFENYQPLSKPHGYGFSLYGEKKLGTKFTTGLGFARIDRTMLNGDRYPQGNRLFVNTAYLLHKDLTVSTAFIQGMGDYPAALPRTRFELILTYNFLNTLRRKQVL